MDALQALLGREMHWSVNKALRQFELRDGDDLVATLRPSYWRFGSKPAVGMCRGEAWSLERHGLITPTFTYRCVVDGAAKQIGYRHVRRRTYQDPMGRLYELKPSSGDRVFTCAERGRPPLVRLHREGGWRPIWTMTISPAARGIPYITGLAMLATLFHFWRLAARN